MSRKIIGMMLVPAMVLACTMELHAEKWTHYGSRSQAMGGAGVALIQDATSSYWNPGALAINPSWDLQIPFGMAVNIVGDSVKQANAIADAFSLLNQAALDGGTATESEIRNALSLVDSLSQLDEGDGLYGDFHVGGHFRFNNMAGGINTIIYTGANAYIDLTSLASLADNGFADLFGSVPGYPHAPVTAPGIALSATLQAEVAGIAVADANELAYQAENTTGLDLTDQATIDAIVAAADATQNASGATIDGNESGLEIAGLMLFEFSFAYAYPLFDNKLGIGINSKLMQGTAFTNTTLASELDDGGDIVSDIRDMDNKTETTTFSIDLGVLYKPFSRLSLGLTARNLTSPTFDIDGGRNVDEITLDPQVRAGVAFDILQNKLLKWVVAADFDVMENSSDILTNFKSQEVGFGTEVMFLDMIAVRVGAYQNMAESDSDPIITAGLGLQLWKLEIDLSAEISTDTAALESDNGDDEEEVPTLLGFGGQVQFNWNF